MVSIFKDEVNEMSVGEFTAIEFAIWEEEAVDWLFWINVDALSAQQFSLLRNVRDPRNFETEKDLVPGKSGKTLEQIVNDDLLFLDEGNTRNIREWVNLACKKELHIPHYMRGFLDKPDTELRSKDYLNHDPILQEKANSFAEDFKVRKRRYPSKGEVAKELSKSNNLTLETIERRIRKEWGKPNRVSA